MPTFADNWLIPRFKEQSRARLSGYGLADGGMPGGRKLLPGPGRQQQRPGARQEGSYQRWEEAMMTGSGTRAELCLLTALGKALKDQGGRSLSWSEQESKQNLEKGWRQEDAVFL